MGHFLKISVAFVVLFLLGHNTQGAPIKGRYMWVRCRPDGSNANCMKEWGPWIDLPGPSDRLPPSAVQDIMKASLDQELHLADGSGVNEPLVESGSGDQWGMDRQELGVFTAEGNVQLEEGSSFEGSSSEGSSFEGSSSEGSGLEVDYTEFVFTQSMTLQQNNLQHELELQEDNLIL
ncbi:hypothetical protein AAFF_G00063470 [Aldrovandia affinis]|uniref:Serglycin n=1 Tax=Aldrovandia affinis TaxID=143900 RepID=A0AAD7RZZ6_9TELE|nr:hypothetical protein AAFF_G00063470 [Aldrovandia affinis]